jgi:hypothetical protein
MSRLSSYKQIVIKNNSQHCNMMAVKFSVFYNITLRSSVQSQHEFSSNTSPPLLGLKNKAQKQPLISVWCLVHAGFFFALFFDPEWRWRQHVPPKRRMFKGLHGVISQTVEESFTAMCFSISKCWYIFTTEYNAHWNSTFHTNSRFHHAVA